MKIILYVVSLLAVAACSSMQPTVSDRSVASVNHEQCSANLTAYYKSISVSHAKDLCGKYGAGVIAFVMRRGSELGGTTSDEHKFDLASNFGVDVIAYVIDHSAAIPADSELRKYELTKQFGIRVMECAIQKNQTPVYGKSIDDSLSECASR